MLISIRRWTPTCDDRAMALDHDTLLATLTLAQKVALLAGHDGWHTEAVPGVPVLRCTDGPAGARGTSWNGPRSAWFPGAAPRSAASFDPALVEEVGRALGRETRSKGAPMLSPTVNLHRTPIGGRNFECMSEDPHIDRPPGGRLREGRAIAARCRRASNTSWPTTPSSSGAHHLEDDVDERTLRELYLVPFEAAVRPVDEGGAGVRTIMSSYNRINGRTRAMTRPVAAWRPPRRVGLRGCGHQQLVWHERRCRIARGRPRPRDARTTAATW